MYLTSYFNPLPPHGGRHLERQSQGEKQCISIHSLRMEGDSCVLQPCTAHYNFNPLPPHGGRPCVLQPCTAHYNFNPLPPHGGRPFKASVWSAPSHFNPLPPHGGRPATTYGVTLASKFQSTPSAWRETVQKTCQRHPLPHFNPLPPHGGRHLRKKTVIITSNFNPLPPHGGRPLEINHCHFHHHFNPLPPHGGRHSRHAASCRWYPISIHSLRMEGDRRSHTTTGSYPLFQSTPSAWRETDRLIPIAEKTDISIHSLRMEGDKLAYCQKSDYNPFQSTPSAWRETSCTLLYPPPPEEFQSTPSAWRETTQSQQQKLNREISIHSLRMEGDGVDTFPLPDGAKFQSTPSAWRETAIPIRDAPDAMHFNPLPPHGGRRHTYQRRTRRNAFQSTPSAWRETSRAAVAASCSCLFQSTPSAWRETTVKYAKNQNREFQSTPSAWRETRSAENQIVEFSFQSTPSAWRETIHVHNFGGRMGFQSTPSAWRETMTCSVSRTSSFISIHSLRMEGDEHSHVLQRRSMHFNPLPPHGGRRESWRLSR